MDTSADAGSPIRFVLSPRDDGAVQAHGAAQERPFLIGLSLPYRFEPEQNVCTPKATQRRQRRAACLPSASSSRRGTCRRSLRARAACMSTRLTKRFGELAPLTNQPRESSQSKRCCSLNGRSPYVGNHARRSSPRSWIKQSPHTQLGTKRRVQSATQQERFPSPRGLTSVIRGRLLPHSCRR
jgi:hypothetical protein